MPICSFRVRRAFATLAVSAVTHSLARPWGRAAFQLYRSGHFQGSLCPPRCHGRAPALSSRSQEACREKFQPWSPRFSFSGSDLSSTGPPSDAHVYSSGACGPAAATACAKRWFQERFRVATTAPSLAPCSLAGQLQYNTACGLALRARRHRNSSAEFLQQILNPADEGSVCKSVARMRSNEAAAFAMPGFS
jgi:hypothetical protein